MERRVTSADVAQAAGVSRATVSYVLNGRSGQSISAATRDRVLAAARTLGYTPSTAARTLRRGRSDVVLMLLPPEPLGQALAMVLDAASEEVERRGQRLLAHRLPPQGGAAALVRSLAPAALILTTPLDPAELAELRAFGTPVASLQDELEDPLSPDLGIGAEQVAHLAGAGHVRLGLALPAAAGYEWRAKVRQSAVEDACARLGLPAPAVIRMELDSVQAAAAVAQWRQGTEPVTAVCAFDDEYAFALLSGLAARGLAAPDDLAVIGAEDIPLAALAVPPLTTVRVDARRLGRRFAQLAAPAAAEAAGAPDGPDAVGPGEARLPPVTLVRRASA
ncbi:HTH-type transcriptional regulator DegA [Arthrobacter saudimassiliensis]|uniref:HTH-type transcriptional regulator DegA n=1 Tax=Arthrobacter saudimassiliensis TaxID=1461584 RepID=A0A078MLL7_9MICC|nr:HTH-type transcriptional regulator DegA [Arthrobacter saudimassiliensis]